MEVRAGELIRDIGFQKSAGYIDGEYSKIDHVHSIDPVLLDFLTSSTDTNMIDNPEFKHYQRTLPITGVNQFGFDRWQLSASGAAVWSHAVGTSWPTGVQTSGLYTVTTVDSSIAAGDYSILSHTLEGYTAARLLYGSSSAKPVTLSFWARSSLAGTYCIALRNSAVNRSYIKEYTLAANTWTKVILTFPGCTDGTWDIGTGLGLRVSWIWSCGSTYQTTANTWTAGNYLATSNQVNLSATLSNTFSITQVQLTLGDYDPPFKSKDHSADLLRCYRFLQRYTDPPLRGVISGATTAARMGMTFIAPFRATPVTTYTGGPFVYDGVFGGAMTAIAVTYNTMFSAEHDLTMGGGGFTVGRGAVVYQGLNAVWTYSAEI